MTRRNPFRLTPPKLPKLRENDVEKACLDLLAFRGYYAVRLQSGLFRTKDDRYIQIGKKGLPDYAVLHRQYPGFFMETKRPKGQLSDEQIKVAWTIANAYRIAVVKIDSVEALREWLDAHEGKGAGEC